MAGGITTTVELSYGMEKVTSTIKTHRYGTRGVTPDGRVFRYALTNGAFTAGRVMQAAVQPGDGIFDMDVPIASAGNAVGDGFITPDFSDAIATFITVDDFQDGLAYVNDGPGEGHVYFLSSHTSETSDFATGKQFSLSDDDQIRSTALTTVSLIGLIKNQYKDVVGIDLDVTYTHPVGVNPADLDDNVNFWLQTWGPAAVLTADNAVVPTLGGMVQPQLTTSDIVGAVAGLSTAVSSETVIEQSPEVPIIGYSMSVAAVDTDYGLIFLQIAP